MNSVYNVKLQGRSKCPCLFGGNSSTSVTFGDCSAIITHCFYFSPPIVIQVFCNVVFEFLFQIFVFLYKKIIHRERLLDKFRMNIDRKQGGPV